MDFDLLDAATPTWMSVLDLFLKLCLQDGQTLESCSKSLSLLCDGEQQITSLGFGFTETSIQFCLDLYGSDHRKHKQQQHILSKHLARLIHFK